MGETSENRYCRSVAIISASPILGLIATYMAVMLVNSAISGWMGWV